MRSAKIAQMVGAAGGITLLCCVATAAQAYTVRCVPSLSVDPKCTAAYSSGTPNAIQAAINASASGDIIVVGPGTYKGNGTTSPVEIPKGKSISLYGAQAGVDPRHGGGQGNDARDHGHAPGGGASIIDATGAGGDGSAIVVRATNVRIDGFTVQGATNGNSTGIDLKGGTTGGGPASGAVVVNNIVQGNSTGISVNSEGYDGPVTNVRIEFNVLANNNAGTPASSGDGLFTGGMQNVVIADNAFSANKTSDVGINSPNGTPNDTHDVTITRNRSNDSATFAIFTGTTNATVSFNQADRLGSAGSFVGAGDSAVSIGPGNGNLLISDNSFAHGQGNIANGIAFTSIFGAGKSTAVMISGNNVSDMPAAQIAAEGTTETAALIDGNQLHGGQFGISIAAGNSGNFLTENNVQNASTFACADASIGGGTLGTADTWFRNTSDGKPSSPAGLCPQQSGD